ncbi:MAG: tetratricopeptide repeat protein [Phycisphaerae bacterium]|nr:tetratricopeptide repeat protein [Phycisphaerae bacterium]
MNRSRVTFRGSLVSSMSVSLVIAMILGASPNVAAMLPPVQEITDPITLKTDSLYRQQLEENPDDPSLLYRQARFEITERRDVAAARAYYERAIEKWPKGSEITSALLLYDYAELLEKECRDYAAAIQVLRRVIDIFPASPRAYVLCGNILANQLRDYDAAEVLLRHAAELEKSSTEAQLAYADFLSEKRSECAAAEKIYAEALEKAAGWPAAKDSTHPLMQHYASSLANCRRDFEAADAMYKKLFADDPSTPYGALEGFADLYATFSKDDAPVEEQFKKFATRNIDYTLLYVNFLVSRSRDAEACTHCDHDFSDRLFRRVAES